MCAREKCASAPVQVGVVSTQSTMTCAFQKTIVFEPASRTSRQCISQSLRRPFEVGELEPENG